MMNNYFSLIKTLLFAGCVLAAPVFAQSEDYIDPGQQFSGPVGDFQEAMRRAVLQSPRVNASWYNFEATREEQRSARGAYLPSVDVAGEYGREERETPLIEFDPYNRDAVQLSITQMLWDGMFTRDEVQRLGYATLADYYVLRRASEETALEAAQSYLETAKFQKLVQFAKDNYVVHRQVYDMIAERAGSGISQGVDLEQAAARIALAESNLVTEMTNLYDVQTRFQNVVGSLPSEVLAIPQIPSSLVPATRDDALIVAYESSPTIDAAIENLRSTQAAYNSTNAPYHPRLDLRYRNELEHDTDGFEGRYDEQAIELVLGWNLYRGGTDAARRRQFTNLYYSAVEERRQACLNVRQSVMISYNEVESLEEQVALNESQLSSQDRTRRAYRDQFDIGQRTLLDLLDSQNEYFDTQRALENSMARLRAAQASTLAHMGLLLASMNIEGLDNDRLEHLDDLDLDFRRDSDDVNTQDRCPIDTPVRVDVDREALFASLSSSNSNYSGDSNYGAAGAAASAAALAGLTAGNDRYNTVGENMASIELKVLFPTNSSIISSIYDDEIANAAAYINQYPTVTAIVEGHTDSTGEDNYNQWLSERRANSVRRALIEKYGVNPAQLGALGYGESQPVDDNSTASGRERNRRVELILNANGG